MTNADKLREFHAMADLPSPVRPTVPDLDLLDLRGRLVAEEADEVREEFDRLRDRLREGDPVDPVELAPLAHELVDLLYVAYGALDSFGLPADAIFAEVHRANLAKAGGPRRADGKLLKPPGWQPADVAGVVARALAENG